jgi:hypothetical protein
MVSIAVDAGRAIMEIYNKPEGWGLEMRANDSPLTQTFRPTLPPLPSGVSFSFGYEAGWNESKRPVA